MLNRKSTIDSGKKMNHLAFGYGTHTCVGAAFSQMQLELTINIMLDKIAGASLPNNFVLKEQGIYTRGPVAMPILCNIRE